MRTGRRHIKDGRQFDHLFPVPKGNNVLIKNNALLEDTIDLMKKVTGETLEDTAALAALLKDSDDKKTCKNVWNFCFNHIQYKEDKKGVEQVRRPSRSWADRKTGVDCDCLSVFIGSILINLGIPYSIRLTRYKQPHFEHVYPIAHLEQEDIIMDAVVHGFNYEIDYSAKKDIAMNLEYLNGVEDDDQLINNILNDDIPMDAQAFIFEDDLQGLEGKAERVARREDRKAKREAEGKTTLKEKLTKGIHVINRVNPATALLRAGILASMKLNVMQVASKLRFAYWSDTQANSNNVDMNKFKQLKMIREKLEKIFFGAGGKPENLKKSILEGKGNRDRSVVLNGLGSIIQPISDDNSLRDILGEDLFIDEFSDVSNSINGLDGLGSVAAAGSAIAAASGVIATISKLIKALGSLFKKGSPQQEQETIQDNTDQQEEKTRKFSIKNIIQKIGQKSPDGTMMTTKSGEIVPGEFDPTLIEPSGDVYAKETDTSSDSSKDEKGVMAWVKNHPLLTGGIVLAAAGGIYLVAKGSKKKTKAKPVSGVRKRKAKPKPKPKSRKKTTASKRTTKKRTTKAKSTSRRRSSTAKSRKVQKVRLL